MTIKLTNWFDTEEESGCCQVEIWKNVNFFEIKDQGTNGLWLQIWFKEGTPEFEKHKEMNGLLYCDYNPEHDQLQIFDLK